MRAYGQRHCPIARASEIFAERWTPIIIRNLVLGCRTFGQILDGAPGLSRTLLTQRLRELERFGLLERDPNPRGRGSLYRLTAAGAGLQEVCDALGTWGAFASTWQNWEHLRCDERLAPNIANRTADNRLRFPEAVDFCCVDQVHSELNCPSYNRRSLFLGVATTVSPLE